MTLERTRSIISRFVSESSDFCVITSWIYMSHNLCSLKYVYDIYCVRRLTSVSIGVVSTTVLL